MAGIKFSRSIVVLLLILFVSNLSILMLLKKDDSYPNTKESRYLSHIESSYKRQLQNRPTTLTRAPTNKLNQHKANNSKVSWNSLLTMIKIPSTEKAQGLKHKSNTTPFKVGCEWVTKPAPKPPFLATAVLLVRIYEADKANLTSREMLQWLEYLRYAGIEHVYVYDAWFHESESQILVLSGLIRGGFVTYVDWHNHNPYTIEGTQVAAYQHCIDHYGKETTWQTAIDIDEYPFSPKDTQPGFFYRYVQNIEKLHGKNISEVTMQNFLYLGKPSNKEFLIDRLRRRTPQPANSLVKPIYNTKNTIAQVHHNELLKGETVNASPKKLRMNHYWGARLQNWGEDTPEVLNITIPDHSIQPIVRALKECKHHFGF